MEVTQCLQVQGVENGKVTMQKRFMLRIFSVVKIKNFLLIMRVLLIIAGSRTLRCSLILCGYQMH